MLGGDGGVQWPSLRKCKYKMPQAQSSRPGTPCLPPAKKWPYRENTAWRTKLGERILKAVSPVVTEEHCKGWILYGDQTWCKKAFKDKFPDPLGLSFGIEERDMYSEYLSNNFKVPTRLFDCFQNPAQSPPMSGKAPNATGPCRGGNHCYETPYQSFRVCLGATKAKVEGRQYDTLSNALKSRGPLSTYVKIDVEGSEWTVLEQLGQNDEDQDKIRTLDMEIHFGFTAASEYQYNSWSQKQRITREITILEGLKRKFYVTGTTLEVYRQGWMPQQDCPKQQCNEPVVHLAGGFSPQMFAISFVNKDIVGVADLDEQPAPPPAAPSADDDEEAASDASEGERSAPEDEDEEPPQPEEPADGGDDEEEAAGRSSSLRAASASSEPTAKKYGFYLHVFNAPAAVIHQVRQVKKYFPGSPIYVMSDGGMSFDELCRQEGCVFQLCPPANDRWHPWPFLRRLYDAALSLRTKYVIMLEPDNTIHGPIKREPTADAGGLPVKGRTFGGREYPERLAQERRPGYRWTNKMMSAGLAGGAYFSYEAITDAFSDEMVAKIDWNYLAETRTKEIFSSDFAMQYALAARGYDMEPWEECAQMERSKDKVFSGAQDAAFRHYCGCYPGGKPTYNLQVKPKDRYLFKEPLPRHNSENSNCQICYNFTKYKQDWGSTKCTNGLPFEYSKKLLRTYFPDGKIPQMR